MIWKLFGDVDMMDFLNKNYIKVYGLELGCIIVVLLRWGRFVDILFIVKLLGVEMCIGICVSI